MSRGRKIGLYLAITFVASWSIGLTFAFMGGDWGSPASQAVAMLFMMPPAFGALVVKGAIAKDPLLSQLGISLSPNPWWLVAWIIPPILVALALAVGSLLPGVELALGVDDFIDYYRPTIAEDQLAQFESEVRSYETHPALGMIMRALLAGVTINAIRGLGEELGWRGLMHHELPWGFWKKSLVTGAVWGIWYAPLVAQGYRYPEHPVVGILLMIAWCTLASPIFSYVRIRSGSVFAAAILYGTLEGAAKIPPLLTGGNDLLVGLNGFAGFVAMGIVLCLLWLHDRRRGEASVMGIAPPNGARLKEATSGGPEHTRPGEGERDASSDGPVGGSALGDDRDEEAPLEPEGDVAADDGPVPEKRGGGKPGRGKRGRRRRR